MTQQHHHHHGGEAHNHAAGQGSVLLDIGSGVGALVLYAPAAMAGIEIEITPAGQDDRRQHVAVLARPAAVGVQMLYAAVYPALAVGSWNLWDPAGPSIALSVTIADGEVTETHWPEPR